jgi:fucose permease
MTSPLPDQAPLRRAHRSTRAQFLMLGVAAGSFGAHVPALAARHGLDAPRLAVALLGTTTGSLLMLPVAGRVVGWLGARRTTVVAGWAFSAALALLLTVPSGAALAAALVLLGAGEGLFDVAVNAEGTVLEEARGVPVMSGLHAMFSAGAMLGAGAAALLYRSAVPAAAQLPVVAAVLALAVTVSARGMLARHPSGAGAAPPAVLARPRGALLLLGGLTLVAMLAEGVMYHWSVLYVREALGAPPARAALAYVSFSAATAATRFLGDAVRARVPERRILRAGALLGAGAMTLVLLAGDPLVALAGFFGVGVGIATLVPILYNAAARVPGVSRATALAAVSSVGYVGFLVGPPVVGAVASRAGLSAAMGTLVVACLLVAAGSRWVPAATGAGR